MLVMDKLNKEIRGLQIEISLSLEEIAGLLVFLPNDSTSINRISTIKALKDLVTSKGGSCGLREAKEFIDWIIEEVYQRRLTIVRPTDLSLEVGPLA